MYHVLYIVYIMNLYILLYKNIITYNIFISITCNTFYIILYFVLNYIFSEYVIYKMHLYNAFLSMSLYNRITVQTWNSFSNFGLH